MSEEFTLRYLGDPCLSRVCTPIAAADEVPEGLVPAMRRIMQEKNGLGLAAPQVGVSLRLALVRFNGLVHLLINPRLTSASAELATEVEGCLSIPGFTASVTRSVRIAVTYETAGEHGSLFTRTTKLHDLEARCVQHEIWHLQGVLITDKLPRQQRRLAERKVMESVGARL